MARLLTAILAVALLRLSPAFADTDADQQATESTSSAAAPQPPPWWPSPPRPVTSMKSS
jgi:hypothetical protein